MNLPSMNSMYVGGLRTPDEPKSGRSTDPRSGFGRVPAEVRRDRRLTHCDVHLYAELAGSERGGVANIGERLLSKLVRIKRRSVRESMARLIQCGYVAVEQRNERCRAYYRLTDPIFSVPAFAEPAEPVSFVSPLITCPKCKKPCGGLLKTGWCRSCNWYVKMDGLVRRVVRQEIASEKSA